MTNRAEFVVGLQGDEGDISKIFAAFKRQIKSDAAEIESTLAKVEFFKGADTKLGTLRDAVLSARQRVVELGQAIASSLADGGKAPEQLTKALAAAEKAATSATNAYNRQAAQVDKLRVSLKTAGVDTGNLAAEQERLAAAAKVAAAATAEQQARQALGLRTLKDTTPEVQRLYAAYNTLATSGTLSAKEIALAQQQLSARLAEVRSQLTTAAPAAKAFGGELVAAFSRSVLPALGFVSAATAVVSTLKAATEASLQFKQGIAEISTVTNLSKDQLAELGEQTRGVAHELGLDLNDSLKAVFELLRSGVPEENVITVLRDSAKAALASTTDLGEGVKAANALLDGFGADVKDLPRLFDAIVQGAHDGGATFKEFADNAGPLLNVARAANIPFDELVATLTVLVDKSGNAQQSISDLTKIIAKIDTAEARSKLHDLGIESSSLVEIFQKIGQKGLALDQVLELGVASTKSAASIAALTTNASNLGPELDKVRDSAGASAKALEQLFDSPEARARRFKAEVDSAEESVGALGSTILRTGQDAGGSLLNSFNAMALAFSRAKATASDSSKSFGDVIHAFNTLPPSAAAAAQGVQAVGAAAQDAVSKTNALAASANQANKALAEASKGLLEEAQAIQSALARDIDDVQARADAEIAALDRTAAATAATEAKTAAIQTKANADKLELIVRAEADITAALEKAVAARTALAQKNGDSERKIATDVAQLQIGKIGEVLQQYQKFYASLIQQSQAAAARVETIDRARVDVNRSIEDEIRAIRLEGLSGLDSFVARQQDIDRLISEGRKAAAQGDTDAAKAFFQEAINESKGLTAVISTDGRQIVTELQARTAHTKALKDIADASNKSFGEQGDAVKKGADKTKEQIDQVKGKLDELQSKYDTLKINLEHGIFVKVDTDEKSVAAALATLNDLTKDRTVTITVNTVNADGTPAPNPAGGAPPTSTGGGNGEQFAHGGMVGRRAGRMAGTLPVIAAFARGGSVFRPPAWLKVPGTGNQDTVPAALTAGSFVMRKAAAGLYGDNLMSRLARGYAAGGVVTRDDVKKFADNRWGFDPFSSKVFDPGNIGGRTDPSGPDGPSAPQTDPKKGFRSGDTFQDAFTQRVINLDTRPIPAALITAANVLAYAKEMLNSVNQANPLLGSLGQDVLSGISAVSRNPANSAALDSLLQAAQTIGSNPYLFDMWGKTAGSPGSAQEKPEWFLDWLVDRGLVDAAGNPTGGGGGLPSNISGTGQPGSLLAQNVLGRAIRNFGTDIADRLFHPAGNLLPNASNNFAKNFFQTAIPAAGDPPFVKQRLQEQLNDLRDRLVRPFAAGGSTDTVPAMLTPGEWVMPAPVVNRYGTNLMHAINSMRLPKSNLDILLSPPRRFADGGLVSAGGSTGPLSTPLAGVSAGATIIPTVNINASAADIFSEANVRRFLLPVLTNISANAFKR